MTDSTAARVVEELVRLGATHCFGVPDNDTAALFQRLREDKRIAALTVTREGEALALAAGAWIGGARPFVVMQNTGLLESGDALRGTVVRMRVPLVVLVGYRGFAKMVAAGVRPAVRLSAAQLSRVDLDSAALLTEPTLDAWSVPFERADAAGTPAVLTHAWKDAEASEQVRAVLLTEALS